jgi:hypothetical protein
MIKNILLFATLSISLVACKTTKKIVAPNTPATPTSPTIAGLPILPESHINVPVKIVIAPILAKAALLIPKEITSEGWPKYFRPTCDFQYKYRFVPGNFTFNCTNNLVQVRLAGLYQVAGERCVCALGQPTTPFVGGSCGFDKEPMRKTDIYITSQLNFQPNYTVRSYTTTQKVTAAQKCTVTLFKMDITQQVLDSIQSSTNLFCKSIDSAINSFNFGRITNALAEKINKKIPLNKYGYLAINPSTTRIGKLNYLKDTLQVVVGISCFPELHSDSSHTNMRSTLPNLQMAEQPAGVTVYTNARYQYPFISSLINQLVKDSSFLLEGNNIIIKNVQVVGLDNNKVGITIDFEGDRKGSLYLYGTPQLNLAQQIISVPDMEYNLQSNDLALRLGNTFLNKKILKTLREKATIHIAELIEKNRPAIDAQLNKKIMDHVFSQGQLSTLKVLALLPSKAILEAQTCTTANVSVVINGVR